MKIGWCCAIMSLDVKMADIFHALVPIETEAVGKLQVESSQKVVEDISKSLKEFHVQQKESRKKVCSEKL